jgi:uncharacterized membrane protein
MAIFKAFLNARKSFYPNNNDRNIEENKMTLESNKILGGIGAILMFVGVLPQVNYIGIIEIIGLILVLVALHNLSNYYKEGGIFRHAIYGVAVAVVGAIIVGVLAIAVVLSNIQDLITQLYPGWNGDWSTLQNMTPNTTNIDPTNIFPLIGGLLIVLVIAWVFSIIAAFFIYRSLKQVSNKSNVGLFGTAGIILLIGAVIPGIGVILMWISALILAIAFFTLKPQEQTIATATSPPPPPII